MECHNLFWGKFVPISILFLSLLCFFNVKTAALDPEPPVLRTKEITIKTTPLLCGYVPYRVSFKYAQTAIKVEPVNMTSYEGIEDSKEMQLPIQAVAVIVKSTFNDCEVSKIELSATDVEKLSTLIIDKFGKITADLPVAQSQNTKENTIASAPIQLKEISISYSPSCIIKAPYTIVFHGWQDESVADTVFVTKYPFVAKKIELPILDMTIIIKSTRMDYGVFRLNLTAAEIANLSELVICDGGQKVEPVYKMKPLSQTLIPANPVFESQPISPQAVNSHSTVSSPIAQGAPTISQFAETVQRGDVKAFQAQLPQAVKAGILYQTDDKKMTIAGHVIMRLRDDLEMLQTLLVNNPKLLNEDGGQLALAGDQKDNILRAVYEPCAVCFEAKYLETLQCGHKFCNDCLSAISAKGSGRAPCPLCRQPIEREKNK